MVTLALLTAACLDPLQASLVLGFAIAYRGPLPTVVAGTAAAVLTETVMALADAGYGWGELIAPRLVAALLAALLAVPAAWAARSAARGVWAALTADDRLAPGGGTAALGRTASLQGAGSSAPPRLALPSRMAPWHMRSYARRHTPGLRCKKDAAFDCESQ